MRIKSFIILAILCFGNTVHAQSWQWFDRMGGPYIGNITPDEKVNSIDVDEFGNSYICGTILDQSTFMGVVPDTLYGAEDAFVAKLSCEGNLIWLKVIGNREGGDEASHIKLDHQGSVYVSGNLFGGYISRPVNFFDSVFYENTDDLFIAKLDTSGQLQWAFLGARGNSILGSFSWGLDLDRFGNINVLTAVNIPGILFGNDSLERGAAIIKFDPSGIYLGHKTVFNVDFVGSINDFKCSPDGHYYITGSFYSDSLVIGGRTLHRITPIPLNNDLYLVQLDTNGVTQWDVHLGGQSYSALEGRKVVFDDSSNVYLAGDMIRDVSFAGTTFYNVLDTTQGNSFPFVAKITPQGQGVWAVNCHARYGGITTGGITRLPDGRIFISGVYVVQGIFGADTISASNRIDMFLAEISPSGSFVHGYGLSCSGDGERPLCIAHDASGNILFGGGYDNSMYFNGNTITYAGGNTDAFVVKFGNGLCTTGVDEIKVAPTTLELYPNPSSGLIHIRGLKTSDQKLIRLYDLSGKLVEEKSFSSTYDNVDLNIGHLKPSLYNVVVLYSDGSVQQKKIVKEQ